MVASTLAASLGLTAWVAGQASAATSSTVAARVKVTIRASTGKATRGQAITFSGATAPRARVTVQAAAGRTWRTLGSAKATSSGSYKIVVKHPGGTLIYRTMSTVAGKPAYSSSVKVTAPPPLRTYDLASLTPATSYYLWRGEADMAAGEAFSSHIRAGLYNGEGTGTWRLNRACTRLVASIAQDDTPKATGTVHFKLDGRRVDFPVIKGRVVPMALDLRGVNILTLYTSGPLYDTPLIGDPKITCTSVPR